MSSPRRNTRSSRAISSRRRLADRVDVGRLALRRAARRLRAEVRGRAAHERLRSSTGCVSSARGAYTFCSAASGEGSGAFSADSTSRSTSSETARSIASRSAAVAAAVATRVRAQRSSGSRPRHSSSSSASARTPARRARRGPSCDRSATRGAWVRRPNARGRRRASRRRRPRRRRCRPSTRPECRMPPPSPRGSGPRSACGTASSRPSRCSPRPRRAAASAPRRN